MSEFEPARRLRGIQKSMIRQVFDRARPGSINLGLGEPDLPTPEVVRREAARVVVEEQNGYTTHAGLPSLRERVASDYPHLSLTPEQVVVTAREPGTTTAPAGISRGASSVRRYSSPRTRS